MNDEPGRYLAYMLRLWQVDGELPVWRASLEDVRTGEKYGFGSLELLFRFLTEQVRSKPEAGLSAGTSTPGPTTPWNTEACADARMRTWRTQGAANANLAPPVHSDKGEGIP